MANLNSYSPEQVQGLLEELFEARKRCISLQDDLKKARADKKIIEGKYYSLCERSMQMMITEKRLPKNTLQVEVTYPVTLTGNEFTEGIVRVIVAELKAAKARRDSHFDLGGSY